ncbi:MAG TPA: LysR family transcriptional regulator, partial [Achromobacter sp.]|nr:LysR family transcriptional regulator [Achromobacter sp.]
MYATRGVPFRAFQADGQQGVAKRRQFKMNTRFVEAFLWSARLGS